MRSLNILQGDGYAFSAEAASDLVVYFCVASSFAGMSITGYFPISQVAAYNLGVTSEDVERDFGL